MNLQEIKQAIADGKTVHWSNGAYTVIKDNLGQYLIKHSAGHCIGLTWADETTLNGKEEDFFIKGEEEITDEHSQKIRALITKELGLPNDGYRYVDFGGAYKSTWGIGGNTDLYSGLFFGVDTENGKEDNVFCLFRPEDNDDREFFRLSEDQALEYITTRKYFITDKSGRGGSSAISFLLCLSLYANDHEDFEDTEDSFYDWVFDSAIGDEYEYDNATTFKRIS